MKNLFIFLAVILFISCESPHKFDFDKYLNGNDADAGNTTVDSDNGDTGDTGDTGNTASDQDAVVITDGDVFIDKDQTDVDQSDMDEMNDADFDADTDNDNFINVDADTDADIDTDIIVEPFCGDGKVSNGEMCDGNIITCSEAGLTGSTGTVTCNPDCSGWVTYPDKCTKSNQPCTGLPSNAVWNTVSSITQTWSGLEWLPTTIGSYNLISSTTECRYKCNTNYNWNGGECEFIVPIIPKTICTGQTMCYNSATTMTCPAEGAAYYGQDSQYAALGYCKPRSYTVSGTSGSDIVTDNNTGLIWQRTLSTSTYTWQYAINYCDGLSYAGHADWRLPTRKELATLPDYERYNPAIDTAIFPGTKSIYYWSSSSGGTDSAWCVNFFNGYVMGNQRANTAAFRCVRGSGVLESSFTESVTSKVFVTDTSTGLIWQKEYSSEITWVNALSYCETSTYAGYSDWRLPNIEELKTLVDDSISFPASSFPGMPSNYFWSSSSYVNVNNTDHAWFVSFDGGVVYDQSKAVSYYTRCVR